MKKVILTLALLLSMIAGAFAQDNNAVYVYRNDGDFNAFLKQDVLKMEVSHYDLDSIYHNEWQTQAIFTPDSVYRIPLEVIDSISYVTPPSEYQPNTLRMNEIWLGYIVAVDDKSITFAANTPSALLPSVNQVIVSEVFEEPIPTGFSGRVTSISNSSAGIVCYVDEVKLSDIYKNLVAVGKSVSYDASRSKPSKIYGIDSGVRFPVPNVSLDLGPVSLSCSPTVTMDYIVCIKEHNMKDYVKFVTHHQYDCSLGIDSKIEGEYKPSPKWSSGFVQIPTSIPGLYGKLMLGGFFHAKGSVSISATQPFEIKGKNGFIYNDGHFESINSWEASAKDTEFALNLDGSLFTGVAVRLLFGIMHEKIASANLTAYIGPELSAHFSLSSAGAFDKSLYKSLKDTEINLDFKGEITPGYRLVGFDEKDLPVSLNVGWNIKKWKLLPEFSNLDWKAKGSGGTLKGEVGNNIIMPVSIGWGLFDSADDIYKTEYFSNSYKIEKNWTSDGMKKDITDLPKYTTYYAYPIVKILSKELRADDFVEVSAYDCPVKITEFKQTGSSYDKDSYFNDGRYYDYKFECATTVAIDDKVERSKVEDWGYVYKDPDGQEKHISLNAFSSPYTDSRYAYYRNESSSTATLYGYIKYKGDNEYYYDEPKDYPLNHGQRLCPDDHHPHAIDLGLPSGTKWACCNVGASSPEKYGGYYAWGETEEKSVYNPGTYQYCTAVLVDRDYWNTVYHNIGSDIAGTSYDVAHVKMGGSWQMTSHDQQKELINNCTTKWATIDGVTGTIVIGKNGNHIFFPAGGYYNEYGHDEANSCGCYWSSTSFNSKGYTVDDCGQILYFNSSMSHLGEYERHYGCFVRAVCK